MVGTWAPGGPGSRDSPGFKAVGTAGTQLLLEGTSKGRGSAPDPGELVDWCWLDAHTKNGQLERGEETKRQREGRLQVGRKQS